MTIRNTIVEIMLIAFFFVSRGEGGEDDTSRVLPGRIALVGAITAGTVAPVHIYQARAWWQGPRAPFRFENDWTYSLNIDKLGHAYGAYVLSHLFSYSMDWSGFTHSTSIYYGSVMGLAYLRFFNQIRLSGGVFEPFTLNSFGVSLSVSFVPGILPWQSPLSTM